MQKRNFFMTLLGLAVLFIITASFINTSTGNSEKLVVQQQAMVFNTDGLYYAEFFDYIYRGHFENIEIKREDILFIMIFEQYLRTFGRQCPSYLPANKVEIMNLVCATEQVTTNGYGMETGRVCIKYNLVGSGLFARLDLYKAKLEVEKIQSVDILQTTIASMVDPNAIGNSVDRIHKAKGLKNDMAQMFTLNSCNNTGIKRFEENLKLFALNKPAIRMQGNSKYAIMKASGGPTGGQNLNKLLDDLVANQGKTWAMNRYMSGSISSLAILQKDNKGRPAIVKANYSYQAFGNKSNGWVQINFTDGLPACIYFFDFPQNCKTPGSSIVASYAQGNYGKE